MFPKQEFITVLNTDMARGVGSLIDTIACCEQLFPSVTVTVYVFATRPEAIGAIPPPGDQEYAYGLVPPEANTVAIPLFPPEQLTFTGDKIVVLRRGGSLINAGDVDVQPLASVTKTE